MTTTAEHPHEEHEHPKFLAHHFDTPQQQFDSGKLGVWLFLTTEILLFSGLFCAYSVYRAMHPEIFEFAHQYLNKIYGAINTIVLIFSSFTMAWAVRCSQLGTEPVSLCLPKGRSIPLKMNHRQLCVMLLSMTIACGAIFMCIKYVEYRDKWREHLLPGPAYGPTELPGAQGPPAAGGPETAAKAAVVPDAPPTATAPSGYIYEESKVARAPTGPVGLNPQWVHEENARLAHRKFTEPSGESLPEPNNAHIFFGIYFLMTGLHGLHVLAGMALIGWVLFRTKRGDFGPEYFSPVDFVGLYWHIVDLVWIFLFPLLYLIT